MEKTAVITGASKGIGRAIAEKIAEEGFSLILNARNEAELTQVAKEINQKYQVKCLAYAADLSKKEDCQRLCAYVKKGFNSLSILVNNTGNFIQGKLMDEPDGCLESQIDTNLYSAYHVTRGLIDLLRASEKAHIFNMCSIASLQAYPNSGSYTISKFALLGFSKSLRAELMPEKISVSSILPGATYTASWAGSNLPEERFIKAKDIADIVWGAYNLSSSALVEEILIRPIEGDI